MATSTKIVVGKYWDGCDNNDADSIAKKINDITTAATTIHAVSITKRGKTLVACVVYT